MKAVAEKRVGLTYDAASQPVSLSRYANLAGTQVVAHTEYDFDQAGRLRGMEHFKGGTTFADYDWTYDAASRMTAFDSLVDGTAAYTNDAAGQLTGADYDYQADETYVYDENGNRVNNGYTVGANNQMTSDGTYRYLYDAEGNRTRRFVDTNANGLLDSGDTDVTEYTWDHRNRLTKVIHRGQYGGAADQVVEHSYDYLNRWVRKVLDSDGDGTADSSRVFVYDGNQIVLDFEHAGTGNAAASDLAHRYLWGPAVDQILAEEAADDGGAEDVLWTLTDHQNTVRDLAAYDSGTDTTTVVNHLVYGAFGEVTSETNAAVGSLFLFTARAFDEDTGLQNNLHRWYDAAVGRWLSEDPLGFAAGDANLQRYVGNRPLTFTDPTGLTGECTCGDVGAYPNGPQKYSYPDLLGSTTDAVRMNLLYAKAVLAAGTAITAQLWLLTILYQHQLLWALEEAADAGDGPRTFAEAVEEEVQAEWKLRGDPTWEAMSLEDLTGPHVMGGELDPELGPGQVRWQTKFKNEVTGEYIDISVNFDPTTGQWGKIKPSGS